MPGMSTSIKILILCSRVHFRGRSTRQIIMPTCELASPPGLVRKGAKAHDLPQPREGK
jgi:hypothetical protein